MWLGSNSVVEMFAWFGQVRVDAVVGIRHFVDAYSEEHVEHIKPLIPQLLNQFFSLMREVHVCSLSSGPAFFSHVKRVAL